MKLLKSTILYSLFVGSLFVAFSFFLFPQNADACELQLDSTLRFRTATTNGGVQPEGWFTEENPPFVYVDFKTINCVNTDTLYLTIFGLNESNGTAYAVPAVQDHPLILGALDETGGMSVAFHPDEQPCFGYLSDTSNSDCLMFAMFTNQPTSNENAVILGMIGDLLGQISLEQGQNFANQFSNGGGSQNPTPGCANYAGYFYQTSVNCPTLFGGWTGAFEQGNFNEKLIDYYSTYTNVDYVQVPPGQVGSAKIAYPGLLYKCEGNCAFNDEWQLIPGSGGAFPYGETSPNDEGVVTVNPLADIYQQDYVPLAPLPFEGLNGGSTPNLGQYLASIFKMGIVVVIILAVIMIVFHGIALATQGAIQKKDEHKKGVWNAILGLLLALGSWLLLNTISPELASNLGIGIPEVELTIDQQLYSEYEQQFPESGEAFVLSGTFDNPQTSPGLSAFLDTITTTNPITSITVNTSTPSMSIVSSNNTSVTIPVTGLGANGVAEQGQGVSQDRKTPKGNWQTTNRTRVAQNMNDAQVSQGGFSMGPAFIGTNISLPNGSIRGIWIHGNKNNNPGPTMGCIRIKNDDVLALARKVQPGISLVIQ